MNLDHAALAALDGLMQGLKDNDEDAVDQAREFMRQAIDGANAAELWVFLVPLKCLLQRQTSTEDDCS